MCWWWTRSRGRGRIEFRGTGDQGLVEGCDGEESEMDAIGGRYGCGSLFDGRQRHAGTGRGAAGRETAGDGAGCRSGLGCGDGEAERSGQQGGWISHQRTAADPTAAAD